MGNVLVRAAAVVAGALSAASALSGGPAAAGEPPRRVPTVDFARVDFGRPQKYLGLDYDVGDRAAVERIAKEVRAPDAEATLRAIHAWIGSHLKYDEKAAYAWRTCGKMLGEGTFGGCADHAMLFGTISRACGIPTVWVKTMDAEWIRDFVDEAPVAERTWVGHVFLEVFLDGRWALLDATQGRLTRDHDVRTRLYPGNRWAYDRGGDPYALLLSVRWEEWKEQTRRAFRGFDVALLPSPEPRPMAAAGTRVLGCANGAVWKWIDEWARQQGAGDVYTANIGLVTLAAWAQGGTVVVADVGEVFSGPGKSFREATGLTVEEVRSARKEKGGAAAIRRKAADGTRWLVLTADGEEGIRGLLSTAKLE